VSASLLSALYSFWVAQNDRMTPLAFYNPFDVGSGQQIVQRVGIFPRVASGFSQISSRHA